jgi:hypothetical protein
VVVGRHLGEDVDLVVSVAQQQDGWEGQVQGADDRGHEMVVVAQVSALVRDDSGQLLIAEEAQCGAADDDGRASIGRGQAVDGRGVVVDHRGVEPVDGLPGEIQPEQVQRR